MSTRRSTAAVALLTAAGLALAACSGEPTGTGAEQGAVTFRVWDDAAASAYEQSFTQFNEAHPEIAVEVEVVPWEEYWERLPGDIAAGEMADIFWTNTANLDRYATEGHLIDLTDAVGPQREEWTTSVADLYLIDETQWGVPQVWDSIALFYNVDLLREAEVDPDELRWDPTGANDTLVQAASALTVDAEGHAADSPAFDPEEAVQFGFNAQHDLQAIGLPFLAGNGGRFQDSDGRYVFAESAGEQSFGYLVDLVNTHQVAPPAEITNSDTTHARTLFSEGELAMFQSGTYSLGHLLGAEVDWDLAPAVQGPTGRLSSVHAVAAVANAEAADAEAVLAVLDWLGSAQGQRPLGESGVGFPAAVGAQEAAVEYWAEQDVDAGVFIEAVEERTIPAPWGARSTAGADGISPVLREMFTGRIDVADALQQAEDAGNEAIAN